jgi:hypothetical protein
MVDEWSRVARERTELVFAVGRTGHTRGHHAGAGGARRAKGRAYRALERAGRAREWDAAARAKFTASTAPYEYVGKNSFALTISG